MKNKAKSEVNGFVYFAVGVAALGGLLFGYDTGVISGAILFITKQFSLSATMEEIVVSSVLVGAVAGATIGGALTGRFGRRKIDHTGRHHLYRQRPRHGSGTNGWLVDCGQGGERNRHRHRFIYLPDVYRRNSAGKGPRFFGGGQHAGDHQWHRDCLLGGLCVFLHRGMALYVRTGGNTILRPDYWNVAVSYTHLRAHETDS